MCVSRYQIAPQKKTETFDLKVALHCIHSRFNLSLIVNQRIIFYNLFFKTQKKKNKNSTEKKKNKYPNGDMENKNLTPLTLLTINFRECFSWPIKGTTFFMLRVRVCFWLRRRGKEERKKKPCYSIASWWILLWLVLHMFALSMAA